MTSNIIVDGGSINVVGSLTPTSGRNNNPETILKITLLNAGKFNIGFIDIDNRTVINIDGDQTELNFFGNAQVTIKGDVKISGDSKMSFGGDSNVLIEGDVDVRGTNSRSSSNFSTLP